MAGFDAQYVPGWDCHGMPIEIQIEKKYGKHLPRARGDRQVARVGDRADRAAEEGLQAPRRARRLGPPVHDDELPQRGRRDPRAGEDHRQGFRVPRAQAGQLVLRLRFGAGRGGGRVHGQGRPGGRRRLPAARRRAAASWRTPSACAALPPKPVAAVIWTTTPWTIPANQALNIHPEFSYDLVDTERGLLAAGDRTQGRLPRDLRADRRHARADPRRQAVADPLPPPVLRPRRAGVPRRVRHARHRHRHRALVAGLRRRGLPLVQGARHDGRRRS